MKTKNEFFEDVFARISQTGFAVAPFFESAGTVLLSPLHYFQNKLGG